MNDDKSIDLKTENTNLTNELIVLRRKYKELDEDRHYVKSLLDAEFEKGIELKKENEQLRKENKELRQDNDIKFWKHQFMTQHNRTQLILHELHLAMNEGYEVSDKFKEWLGDLREKNKEVITKHERLFE